MRRPFLATALCMLALGGCSKSTPVAAPVAPTPTPAVVPYALYHAYGDSITYGLYLSSTSLAYPALVASAKSLPLTNYAISGSESCDLALAQIFPNQDSPSLAIKGLYSVLVGTNDIYVRGGSGPGESTFNLCHRAVLAWLGTPAESKVLATAPAVSTSGPTHLETGNHINAVTTDAAGASVSFPFTNAAAAPLYLWYQLFDGSPGTFTCALDNTTVATLTTSITPAVYTQNGTPSSVGILRLPTVAAGTHTFRCTQTSAGADGMGLLAIGLPPAAGTLQRPRVLAGLLTLQYQMANTANIAAYDADITANVAVYAGDGLDIELFDAAKYMTGTLTGRPAPQRSRPPGSHQSLPRRPIAQA